MYPVFIIVFIKGSLSNTETVKLKEKDSHLELSASTSPHQYWH